MIRILLLAAICLVGFWTSMIVLARRLPPGRAKDLAKRVPRHVLFEAWPAEPRLLERLVPPGPVG